ELCKPKRMKSLEHWLSVYGESHKNALNTEIHLVCVPLIFLSILGLTYSIPLRLLQFEFHAGAAGPLALLVTLYYLKLSWRGAAVLFVVEGAFLAVLISSGESRSNIALGSALVFFIAWIGQFVGHKIEGKKPS